MHGGFLELSAEAGDGMNREGGISSGWLDIAGTLDALLGATDQAQQR
jgi:hypothetical protein